MSGADESNPGQQAKEAVDLGTPVSELFFVKVNDMIAAANRIEQHLDTHHAELVMLHAFSRYSAHHYRSTVKVDDKAGREAFAAYIARGVEQLVISHLEHMAGPPADAVEGGQAAAVEPGAE